MRCNAACGSTIDAAVAEAFLGFRVVLGIEGDREQTASVPVTDAAGRRLYLDRGLSARFAPGPPAVTKNADGTITGRFASEKAFRKFVDAMRRKRQGAPANVSNVTVTRTFPGPVTLNFEFGGNNTLRSCAKSALTLVAHKGGPELGLEAAWKWVATGEARPIAINFTAARRPWTPTTDLGPVPHFVAVVASGQKKSVSMQVRLFGDIGFAGTLATNVATRDWRYAYIVDPLTGREAETSDFVDELGEPVANTLDASEQVRCEIERILGVGMKRSANILSEKLAHEIVMRHLRPVRGGEITTEVMDAISRDVQAEMSRFENRATSTDIDLELQSRLQQRAKR